MNDDEILQSIVMLVAAARRVINGSKIGDEYVEVPKASMAVLEASLNTVEKTIGIQK